MPSPFLLARLNLLIHGSWVKPISNEKERKIRFKLLIPYHQLSGNMNLREVPCSPSTTLDELEKVSVLKEMNGAVSLPQPSVQ